MRGLRDGNGAAPFRFTEEEYRDIVDPYDFKC